MKLNSEVIVKQIYDEFTMKYKAFSKFPYSGDLWDECVSAIYNVELLKNIIFCNDTLGVPPVKTFLSATPSIEIELTDYEKRALGAFWGFVFKYVLMYSNQKNISVRVKTIKSASYFYDGDNPILIENIHRYKDYIDKENIIIDGTDEVRYLLEVPYKKYSSDKSVLVILKNPSKANKEKSDHTINNVLKYCNGKYKKVYIMNLFPCYYTNAPDVKKYFNSTDYQSQMKKNRQVLQQTLNCVDDVIIAWGGNSIGNEKIYTETIKSFKQIMSESGKIPHAVRLKGENRTSEYPWHAQVWAVNKELELYKWEN